MSIAHWVVTQGLILRENAVQILCWQYESDHYGI
jgi:hypothetical protein